jgi:hypothetical protein
MTEVASISTRIGLLDVDYAATVVVISEHNDGGYDEKEIVVPLLGDRAFQALKIGTARVRWIKLMLARSGAVFIYIPSGCLTNEVTKRLHFSNASLAK